MTDTPGLTLDALALLLTGLGLLTVASVHGLLWRTFHRPLMRRWAWALLALVSTDLAQVAVTGVESHAIGRALGIGGTVGAFTFFVLTLRILEFARGTSRAAVQRQSVVLIVLAVVTLAWATMTEPVGGLAPGAWYRATGNPVVRAIFTGLIVVLAVTAWQTVRVRAGETGIRIIAIGSTLAIGRPIAIATLATGGAGPGLAGAVVLVIFSLVVDAMFVGVGSVMMALEDERADAIARATRVERAERMERLGMMAGSIAHDLNNLLTAMMSGVELARDPAATRDEVQRELVALQDVVDHGRAMTTGLLSFAKGARRESPPVALGRWLAETRAHLQFALGAPHELTVRVEGDDALPVRVDAARLHQLLLNTVLNSRDAVPAGGVCRVEITLRGVQLTHERPHGVFLLRPGRWAVIRVADGGPGFPVDALDKVFEPFFSTKGARGTGLGLATVFAAARDAGGAVHAFNAPEGGAVIECWLPVAESS